MNLVPRDINEAIKHLTGRTEEEIGNMFKNIHTLKEFFEMCNYGVDIKYLKHFPLIFQIQHLLYKRGVDTLLTYSITYKYTKIRFFNILSIIQLEGDDFVTMNFKNKDYKLSNLEDFKKAYGIKLNEAIKHLTPRSEEEIKNNIKKMLSKDIFDTWLDTDDINFEIMCYSELVRRNAKEVNNIVGTTWHRRHAHEINESIKHLTPRSQEELSSINKKISDAAKKLTDRQLYDKWYLESYPEDIVYYKELKRRNSPRATWIRDSDWYTEYRYEMNESIKHLTPRSEQELQTNMKNLPPQEKLKTGARQGITWLVKDAIAAGANVHTLDDRALRWASYNGHAEVVKLLLDAGANVHAEGDLALRWASYYGNVEVVKLLLDAGADVHAALRWASRNGHAEVVKRLKQYGAKHVNESIKHLTPRSEQELRLFVKEELTPYEKLKMGCLEGLLWMVEDAVKEGIDPSVNNNQSLLWACQNGYLNIVKYLLKDKRVDPTDLDSVSLRAATFYRHYDIVKLLLDDGRADPAAMDNEPFLDAIRSAIIYNDYSLAKLLLKDGRVNPKDIKMIEKMLHYKNFKSFKNVYKKLKIKL